MRSIGYAVREAVIGLRRDWRTGSLALIVIASAVFVTAVSLVATRAIDRVVDRLTSTADLSVFLSLEAGPDDRARVEEVLKSVPVVARVTFVSQPEAASRFARAYPDLAPLLQDGFALPASFDVLLRADGAGPPNEIDDLMARLRALPNVDDVRYDRLVVQRAAALARSARLAGVLMAAVLALAGAVAIFSVVRLAYVARRDEVEILYLVGAPLAAIRGPFIVEGALQATLGAMVGVGGIGALLAAARARAGEILAQAAGPPSALALTPVTAMLLVAGAAVIGAGAAWLAVRSAWRGFTA